MYRFLNNKLLRDNKSLNFTSVHDSLITTTSRYFHELYVFAENKENGLKIETCNIDIILQFYHNYTKKFICTYVEASYFYKLALSLFTIANIKS